MLVQSPLQEPQQEQEPRQEQEQAAQAPCCVEVSWQQVQVQALHGQEVPQSRAAPQTLAWLQFSWALPWPWGPWKLWEPQEPWVSRVVQQAPRRVEQSGLEQWGLEQWGLQELSGQQQAWWEARSR